MSTIKIETLQSKYDAEFIRNTLGFEIRSRIKLSPTLEKILKSASNKINDALVQIDDQTFVRVAETIESVSVLSEPKAIRFFQGQA